jgi:hypothetical protein
LIFDAQVRRLFARRHWSASTVARHAGLIKAHIRYVFLCICFIQYVCVFQAAVRPRLTDMLIAYVDTVLSPLLITLAQPSRTGDDSGQLNTQTLSQLQILAAVCVEFCISVHRCDVLFGLIYPKFRSLPGGESVFLQLLEPFIVTGRLNTLSPPVLKYVVDRFCIGKMCIFYLF